MKLVFYIFLCFFLFFGFSFQIPLATNTSEEEIHYDITFSPPPNASDIQHAWLGSKKCMKQLGCFEITRDFFKRPLNFLPQDRVLIDTKFKLYTKLHPMEEDVLDANDPEDILESQIDSKRKTIFIVHGFFDSTFYGKWMENLKTSLLLHGDYNVIIVDWSKGNGAPYTQATANTRVVGAEIALLIETLEKLVGISPMNCHIIGHSLGAHIAGYAGERLNKLGRITALDPAKPYFQNMPPSVRIDPTDADFVDVIHTDSSSRKFLALGMSQAVGHVDFYPNNGMTQPGCTSAPIHSIFLEGLFDAVRQFVSCSHQRAVDFFISSLNYRKVLPVAHRCNSWKDYSNARCSDCGKNGEKCAVMGIDAEKFKKFKNDTKSVKMYLSTAPEAPFWERSYQITVKLAKPTTKFRDTSGDMHLTFKGTKMDYAFKLSKNELIHGATYSFLVSKQEKPGQNLGKMKGVTFKWESSDSSIFSIFRSSKDYIYLDYIKVTPMNVVDKVARDEMTKKYCYSSTKAIISKESVVLLECS